MNAAGLALQESGSPLTGRTFVVTQPLRGRGTAIPAARKWRGNGRKAH